MASWPWFGVRAPIQLLLALVASIQVVTTLIDYSYRAVALGAYPLLNDRTEMFTQVDIAISMTSLLLQLLSGAFVTVLGIRLLIVVLAYSRGGRRSLCLDSPHVYRSGRPKGG